MVRQQRKHVGQCQGCHFVAKIVCKRSGPMIPPPASRGPLDAGGNPPKSPNSFQLPFPSFPLHSPFSSLPLHCHLFSSLAFSRREAAPLNPARGLGECCKLGRSLGHQSISVALTKDYQFCLTFDGQALSNKLKMK